jgi:hypothetical protein
MTQRHSEKVRSSCSLPQYLSRPRLGAQGVTASPAILSRGLTAPPSQNRLCPSSSGMLPSAADAGAEMEEVQVRRAIAQGRHDAHAIDQGCIMHLTINADCVTQLRHVVIGSCGELVAFMRIQPIAHATRMKVWLGLSKPVVDRIMVIVMQNLPGAEFGQVRPL